MGKTGTGLADQVYRAIAAGVPVIYVVTWEEERLEDKLVGASRALFGDDRPLWVWTAA